MKKFLTILTAGFLLNLFQGTKETEKNALDDAKKVGSVVGIGGASGATAWAAASLLGFKAAGIQAGSAAAGLMAGYAGTVRAGSAISVAQ